MCFLWIRSSQHQINPRTCRLRRRWRHHRSIIIHLRGCVRKFVIHWTLRVCRTMRNYANKFSWQHAHRKVGNSELKWGMFGRTANDVHILTFTTEFPANDWRQQLSVRTVTAAVRRRRAGVVAKQIVVVTGERQHVTDDVIADRCVTVVAVELGQYDDAQIGCSRHGDQSKRKHAHEVMLGQNILTH